MLRGIKQFREEYGGKLGIQSMILAPWDEMTQEKYIRIVNQIHPSEIHLNRPKRPKPLKHQLDALLKSSSVTGAFVSCTNFKVCE